MDSLQLLMQGFTVALQPMNVLWVTLGGVLGTVIGMLPGLGPATGVAVLLPLTFTMGPVAALITGQCTVVLARLFLSIRRVMGLRLLQLGMATR